MTNKLKVLHLVSGSSKDGAFKGVSVLHEALLDLGIKSTILNDCFDYNEKSKNIIRVRNIYTIKKNIKLKILSFVYILTEKILKSLFLKKKDQALQLDC